MKNESRSKNTDITINVSWKSQHIPLDGVTNAINKSSNPINMDTVTHPKKYCPEKRYQKSYKQWLIF